MHSSVIELSSTIVELDFRASHIMGLKFYTDGTSILGVSLRTCRTVLDDAVDQAVVRSINRIMGLTGVWATLV